ncbi:PAS domain-containing sensor histidine kinase [Candidatus Saccharibacteria bacterium]|nr:PAS domain-containing sensor histidine kinase [Candidatus Saccharibacteria bacterium]
MSLFNRTKQSDSGADKTVLAEMALMTIHDGVIITNKTGAIQFINPAAVTMTEFDGQDAAIGLDYGILIKLETKEGRAMSDSDNSFLIAMNSGQSLDRFAACLIGTKSGKRIPVAISVVVADGGNRIITFRDITKELAEEGEQAEFISTASHEMRTPVASIEGYLSLALNPQTASIDERARGYLDAAHAASQHLGHLFKDLLDVTKLDDGHLRPNFQPVEMVGTVKQIADGYLVPAKNAKLNFQFGANKATAVGGLDRRLDQVVYGYVDVNFLHEIMDNLIDNAIKYTPAGGSIYVNVLGDGDRVLINVTDTGIGISSDDLQHIFQKFYRADNSDTRTIGGTGLGLYLVKQRVEAMGGRVWAESAFGEGSTFYVSLPRITGEEYEKRMIAINNTNGGIQQ